MGQTGNRFDLEIGGQTVASFADASGLSEQGGDIKLSKVSSGASYLKDWFAEAQGGTWDNYRRNGSIVTYDPQGTETARWNFVNGWPKEWKASDLDAGADEVATEEVVITHEGITKVH